ncbi:MAG: TetR/AcrR family transcriptional regulator [Sedimentitalea sp.]
MWLDAAYDLLVSDGIDAVKVMPLAKRLGLTRTGFYWHFKDVPELHKAIIDLWKNRNTGVMVRKCAQPADSLCEALFNLIDCWIDPDLFDAALDLAIRNWARTDPDLQTLVDASDEQRLGAVTDLFIRFGTAPDIAHYRALTAILTQTGYYSMRITEPRAKRAEAGCRYVEVFAGVRPNTADTDAFLARHR